jgi:hypothetical protein
LKQKICDTVRRNKAMHERRVRVVEIVREEGRRGKIIRGYVKCRRFVSLYNRSDGMLLSAGGAYFNGNRVDEGTTAEFDYFHDELEAALFVPVSECVMTRSMLIPLNWE